MYIARVPTYTSKKKLSHVAILLRKSYRENGKTKTKTIANLTHEPPEVVSAIEWALTHNKEIQQIEGVFTSPKKIKEGKSIGAVYLIKEYLKKTGIEKALGNTLQAKLAMMQIMARIIDQGSRLSTVRISADYHAICEVLGIEEEITEDDLYRNLRWLSEKQASIEQKLFKIRYGDKKTDVFLYDVTSSYMEGSKNVLAIFGYNRDKKKGKMQVVVGLLCDEDGNPISVKVFKGNTLDFKTVSEEIKQIAEEFSCRRIIFVGDRGMIKSQQIEEIQENDFYYITAITKSQIETMLKSGLLQMSMFDTELTEVYDEETRYILRRNPVRAAELMRIRKMKELAVEKLCRKKTEYLQTHNRSKLDVALKEIESKIKSNRLGSWLSVKVSGREIQIEEDKSQLSEESKLDGCYVIKSNLDSEIKKEEIHRKYKELSKVEGAFRCSKTELLEMRPWYVRCEASTRGHALVVMMSLIIIKQLEEVWKEFDLTVEEGIKQLSTLCLLEVERGKEEKIKYNEIPKPREMSEKLLKAAKVKMPEYYPAKKANVRSRKKLIRK